MMTISRETRRTGRTAGRRATAISAAIPFLFVTPIWAADAASGRGSRQLPGESNASRIGQVTDIAGRWCRQTSILKVGDNIFVNDRIKYCGSTRRPNDRLTIRFEPAAANGKPSDHVYE